MMRKKELEEDSSAGLHLYTLRRGGEKPHEQEAKAEAKYMGPEGKGS
jgi:hypothetical protein